MDTLLLFAIKHNIDQTEGRGPFRELYYTRNQEITKKIISLPAFYKKYGVQGQPEGDHLIASTQIKILDSVEDFLIVERDKETLDALDKLTPRQRELLGLSSNFKN